MFRPMIVRMVNKTTRITQTLPENPMARGRGGGAPVGRR
jgi:hypothetical protein